MNQKNTHNSLKWYSKDIAKNSTYLRYLSDNEKSVVLHALTYLENDDLLWEQNTIKSPLFEAFQPLYNEIMDALIHKAGFILMKGFPTSGCNYSVGRIKKFLLEFCLYLGMPLKQNKKQDLIFDVKSIEGFTINTKNSRGPYVKEALPMHTDAGAILGMYCLSAADVGGLTLLASSHTVHDEIKKIRPDLLTLLYQPFYVDRRGHEPEGSLPYDLSPVFTMYDGDKLMCQYHQPFYTDAQKKFPHIPRLTSQQLEAFELFDQISKQEDIPFEIKIEPGSIIFINNEKILYGRTTFDHPENQTLRHLLRIWLNTPKIEHTFTNYLGYELPSASA